MKTLNALLDSADERLRDALLLPAKGWMRAGCAALTAAAFFLVMMTRTLTQLIGAEAPIRALSVGVICLPLLVMLYFACRMVRENEGNLLMMLIACMISAVALLARVSFIERSSGDYDIYLAKWMDELAAGSFSACMKADIGEYNVLYQYILFIITRLPVPALYAVKSVSFIGDAMLAGGAAYLCAKEKRPSLAAFGTVLLLPTAVLNGGMFAQCDSLYAACAVWALAHALRGRPGRAGVCFALSLSFKLQAAFILPMIAVLWADRKLRVKDALGFGATLIAVMLPAVLGGKSMDRIISIYTAQTGIYTGLNYNAPNLFALMPTEGLDVYAYGNFAMALAFGACALLVYAGVHRADRLDEDDYVGLSFAMVLLIVFLLPRMHERYFYLADILAVCLACRKPKMAPAAALAALASLSSYWEMHIPLALASGMMLAAGILALTGFAAKARSGR